MNALQDLGLNNKSQYIEVTKLFNELSKNEQKDAKSDLADAINEKCNTANSSINKSKILVGLLIALTLTSTVVNTF